MRKKFFYTGFKTMAFIPFVVSVLVSPVMALDKDFGSWNGYSAHQYTQNGIETCNMYALPEKIDLLRQDAQFNVTNRPNKPHRIAIHMGITLDVNSPATLKIKNNTYTLIAYKEYVFVTAEDQDKAIYNMKMGAKFSVSATSEKGEKITDTYSLMGFTRALQTLDKYC